MTLHHLLRALAGSRRLGLAFALVAFALLLLTAGSIGVTWDEPIYSEAAERAARWLGLVARGDVAHAFEPYTFGIGWGLVHEHPPLMRIVNGIGWTLSRHLLPVPISHRVGTMTWAALALGWLVAVTAQERGPGIGLFAGAAVLSMPRLFYHAHLAALDFPLAATWMAATLAMWHATQRVHQWSPLLIGTMLGLALLTKINAVLLIPYWGVWFSLYRRRALPAFVLSLPVALAVLIVGWPWLWRDPLNGLANWLRFFGHHFDIRQWFAGQLYSHTPWYVPPVTVIITTPVLLLLLAAVGAVAGWRRSSADEPFPLPRWLPSPWLGLHLLGLLVVLVYFMLPITAIHDQERLLLPAFLHLAVLAAEGYGVMSRRWQRLGPNRPPPFAHGALATLLLLPGIVASVQLHPFQLAYYNALVGGPVGARRLDMETIYFASTYGHFLPYLNALPAGSRVWVMPNSYDVLYYYMRNGLLRNDLIVLRPPGWGSFYDDAGVPSAAGGLDRADVALIERRQTSFNANTPESALQMEWAASRPEIARLERRGVILAGLYAREGRTP